LYARDDVHRVLKGEEKGGLMQRLGRSWRRGVVLSVALAVILFVSVKAVGFPGGVIFAIAVGSATAVAAFSDSRRHDCLPRFLHRRRT
jgi:hypothetical protein